MEANRFEGVWEDVAIKHAKALRGRRVEIRLLNDSGRAAQDVSRAWSEFEETVRKVTAGKRIPGGRLLTAEDFYESSA